MEVLVAIHCRHWQLPMTQMNIADEASELAAYASSLPRRDGGTFTLSEELRGREGQVAKLALSILHAEGERHILLVVASEGSVQVET